MNIQNKEQWAQEFVKACEDGKIENLRHCCKKRFLEKGWSDMQVKNNGGFDLACQNGHLEVVKYLLTSPELKEAGHTFANLQIKTKEGFNYACYNGHLDVVRYLLTSPELKEAGHTFANLHASNEEGFRWACYYGHLDIVKYLTTSNELKEAGHTWADIHVNNEQGFRQACEDERWDVIRWMVMDYGIDKTSHIKKILEDYQQAKEYFRVREELKEIQSAIKETSIPHQDNEHKEDRRAAKKAKKL